MNCRRRPLRWITLVVFGIAVAFVFWLRDKQPDRVEQLVRDLGARESWYYRQISTKYEKDIINRKRSFIPRRFAVKAEQAEMHASMRRSAAARELVRMGTNAWPAIPALLDAFDIKSSGNAEFPFRAGEVLAGIRADQSSSWPELKQHLVGNHLAASVFMWLLEGRDEGGRPFDRWHRLFALRGLAATAGPTTERTLAELRSLCQSTEDYEFRTATLDAIGSIGTNAKSATPVMQKLIAEPNEWPQVRAAAMQALASVTSDRKLLANQLRSALIDESAFIRIGAASALWKLEARPDEVLPVLTNALSHKLAGVRVAALQAMVPLGRNAAPAGDLLLRLATDENPSVRNAAHAVLKSIE